MFPGGAGEGGSKGDKGIEPIRSEGRFCVGQHITNGDFIFLYINFDMKIYIYSKGKL